MGFYVSALVVFVLSVIGAGAIGYTKGSASRNSEIAKYQAAIKASEKLAQEADERAAKVSATVVTEYRDRVKVIREYQPAQIIERVVREADPSCVLPPSYRELWDGTTAPGSSTAESPARVDGPPVTVAELAAGTAEAKRRFAENSARLESLQAIINGQ